MIREEAVAAAQETIEAAEALLAHIDRLSMRLAPAAPFAAASMLADDEIERVHALLRMFEQLYDLTARRLFRGALLLVGEDPGASAKAVGLRLEKLDAIPDRGTWLRVGDVRNVLVHEYPLSRDAFAAQANLAWEALPALSATVRQVIAYIRSEGLTGD